MIPPFHIHSENPCSCNKSDLEFVTVACNLFCYEKAVDLIAGIAAFTEPKATVGHSITAGIRFEGDVLFGGKIAEEAENLEVGMSTRAAILLRGEYFIDQGKTRPFVGLGFGRYTLANTSASGSGAASIVAGNNFGVAPELGFAFGNFKLSAMYHFVGGTTLVNMEVGDPMEISNNYLGILMSFRIFGVNDRE